MRLAKSHLARRSHGDSHFSQQTKLRPAGSRCRLLRSSDGGLTWEKRDTFPKAEAGWSLRIAHTADKGDCGYPSSVQLADGSIVTAWYSNSSPGHKGYQLGVSVWKAATKK